MTSAVLRKLIQEKQRIYLIFSKKNKNVEILYNYDYYHCELDGQFSDIMDLSIINHIDFTLKENSFNFISKLYSYFPLLVSIFSLFTAYIINREQSIKIEACKQKPNKTFDEIYANDLLKQKMITIIQKIKNNKHSVDDKILLISGPSGTGKTMMANAFANEMRSDYIYKMTGFDVIKNNHNSKFITELFKILKNKKAVLFIDEIDALAYNEALLLELTDNLQHIKTDDNYTNLVVLLATNNLPRINVYFKKFKKLYICLPNEKERLEILKGYALKFFGKLDRKLEPIFKIIAKQSKDMSGSQLEEIFNTLEELYIKNHGKISSEQILQAFKFVQKTFK